MELYKESLPVLQKSLEFDPTYAPALVDRIISNYMLHRFQKAYEYFHLFKELYPNSAKIIELEHLFDVTLPRYQSK